MRAIERIATALQILESKLEQIEIDTLNSSQQDLIRSFQILFKAFIPQFHAANLEEKMFHFAALYSLTQTHHQIFSANLSPYKPSTYYLFPMIYASSSERYFAYLVRFLIELSDLFSAFCISTAGEQYVEKTGQGWGVEYFWGDHMQSESIQPSTSILALEKRIFAMGYFDFIRLSNEDAINKIDTGAACATALALISCSVGGFVSIGTLALLASWHFKDKSHQEITTLNYVSFKETLDVWRAECKVLLERPESTGDLIRLMSERGPVREVSRFKVS